MTAPILERAGALLEGRAGDEVGELIVEHMGLLTNDRGGSGIGRRGGRRVRAGDRASPGRDGLGTEHRRLGAVFAARCAPAEVRPRARWSLRATELPRSWVKCLAESRGCRHAIFLAVGTGIGTGILVDRSILRGAHDIAGAIGSMGLDRPYQVAYRHCGGFESHASGAGCAGGEEAARSRARVRGDIAHASAGVCHGP